MSTASLIYWQDNVSKEEIEIIINDLKNKGLIFSDDTREYNYDFGSPVWYVP